MKKNIIALDLSTTVCGYTVINSQNELVNCSYYRFKEKELIDRAEELIVFLKEKVEVDSIGTLVIEENLKSFRAGGTSADAMLNTSKLNFLCQYISKYNLKLDVIGLNVTNARNVFFPGFTKLQRANKKEKGKEIAFKLVMEEFKKKNYDIKHYFPTKILKSGIRKGLEIFIDECGDISDSYVLSQAYFKKYGQ